MDASQPIFTPSELVYLNGEQFSSTAVFNTTRLIHVDLKVSAMPLAQAMIAAAFITLAQHRTLRLEMRKKKVLLGLASRDSLYADPVGTPPGWPAGTLEAALLDLAAFLAASQGKNEVSNIVYAWLKKDASTPVDLVFDLIKQGLAMRGLLEARQETHLKIFKSVTYLFPESTRRQAAAQPYQPLQQLLTWHQQTYPEIHAALLHQIKQGIDSRTERDESTE